MVKTFVAKKSLGQNFLTDCSVARLMVTALGIQKNDEIVEVGAGLGAITQPLVPACNSQGARLTAVEFDRDLIPALESKIQQNENVKIINANILNLLDDPKTAKNAQFKCIGSLPYNIASPLIHRLVKNNPMPKTCVFLIQKEVAQKICAQAPNSNYLSVFAQTFYKAKILKIVDKNLFDPIPKVDGAIIKLEIRSIEMGAEEVSRYEKFLHRVFSHPRKMLNKVFKSEELEKYRIEGDKRPQDYGWEKYLSAFLAS